MLSALQIILLSGAFQGLLLAVVLFTRKNNPGANRILGILLLILGCHVVLVAFDNRAFFMRFPHLSKLSWLIPTLYGPLILLFVRRLTGLMKSFGKQEWLYFIPFVLWLIYLSPYFLQPAAIKQEYLDNFHLAMEDDFGVLNQLTNVLHVAFVLFAIRLLHIHRERIKDYYSNTEKVRLDWLQQFLYFVLAVIVIGIFAFYARKFRLPVLMEFYYYHFLAVVAAIYWIGYKAVSLPQLFTGGDEPVTYAGLTGDNSRYGEEVQQDVADTSGKYLRSALSSDREAMLAEQLHGYMIEERPYLDSELTIQQLAESLGVSRHHISQVINNYLGKSFYDYINDYRIAAFKENLATPGNEHYTILAIAYQSGFNSKATFNAVFKKRTGMTPTEFNRQLALSA